MNLIVGGTGFVGGHLVEYLFQQGEISKGIFRMGSHLKIMDATGVQGIEADLLDHHTLHEAMEGVDAVYSLASPMPDSDSDFMKVNTEGVLNILEVAGESKVKVFVHLSTLDVHGFSAGKVSDSTPLKPSDGYQKSKAESERLLLEYSRRNELPRIVIVRAAKAIGSRDMSVVVPILRMLKGGRVVLPSKKTMSWSHPSDISQAMFKAATGNPKPGGVYLLKSFDATPEDVAKGIASELGMEVQTGRQGILGGSAFPKYATEQLKASLSIDDQPNWAEIGYAPLSSLKSTSAEIAKWHAKEPWVADAD